MTGSQEGPARGLLGFPVIAFPTISPLFGLTRRNKGDDSHLPLRNHQCNDFCNRALSIFPRLQLVMCPMNGLKLAPKGIGYEFQRLVCSKVSRAQWGKGVVQGRLNCSTLMQGGSKWRGDYIGVNPNPNLTHVGTWNSCKLGWRISIPWGLFRLSSPPESLGLV